MRFSFFTLNKRKEVREFNYRVLIKREEVTDWGKFRV